MEASQYSPTRIPDRELRRFLAEHVRGVTIDEQRIQEHVIRPQNIAGVFSDRGPEEIKIQFKPAQPVIEIPHHLDVGAFGVALHNALKDRVAGYSAQLRQQGRAIFTSNWQFAKRPPQDGGENWTPDVQMHVASLSKLITGMAMTLLFIEKNISPDAQIIDYLPDYWVKGPNIQHITFRQLMNHTSGLTGAADFDFFSMKVAIENGISLDSLDRYSYQNVDFGLCRILLAVVNGNINKRANFSSSSDIFSSFHNDLVWDAVTIGSYAQYTINKVFRPGSVFGATLDHPDAAALAYKALNDPDQGWNSGSLGRVTAAAGWHVSVDQVLNVMSEFRRGRSIVTPEAAQIMLDNGFGVDPLFQQEGAALNPAGFLTPAGALYCKNGRWYDSTPIGHEEQCLAYFLPQDMELVVFANSPIVVDANASTFLQLVTQVYLDNLTMQLTIHP